MQVIILWTKTGDAQPLHRKTTYTLSIPYERPSTTRPFTEMDQAMLDCPDEYIVKEHMYPSSRPILYSAPISDMDDQLAAKILREDVAQWEQQRK